MRHLTFDKTIKVFSSEGRLNQIEYAFKAVASCGLTAVALRGSDCVVTCIQKKVPDKLIDPASITSFHKITDTVGCVMLGYQGDNRMLLNRLRYEANNFKYENGYNIPVHVLAGKLSSFGQLISQYAFYRTPCTRVVTILMSIDEEKGPQIFKVDPAGYMQGYKGCTAGTKEQEATTLLEKAYKKKAQNGAKFSNDEATETVIDVLQNVIGADFKPGDVEVAISTTDSPVFRVLASAEIEKYLNIIADRS